MSRNAPPKTGISYYQGEMLPRSDIDGIKERLHAADTKSKPPEYRGRDPVNLEEANALTQRYCDGEFSLSEQTNNAILLCQKAAIQEQQGAGPREPAPAPTEGTTPNTSPGPKPAPCTGNEAAIVPDSPIEKGGPENAVSDIVFEVEVPDSIIPTPTEAEEQRQGSLNVICRDFQRTDLGNSERFVKRYGKEALFCHTFGSWYVWDGTRWARDASGRAMELAKDTMVRIGDEAGIADGETARSDLFKWAASSQARARIEAMLALAQSSVPVLPEALDANPSILNFPNGTLDLITFKFRKPNREDHCTKATGAAYNPGAGCPLWLNFLEQIMGGKPDLIAFLQRAAGYSLTADIGERAIFLCYGSGANGKSTFLNTLAAALGDYAMQTESSTFTVSRGEAVRNDLARLKGARFVSAIESGKGKRLDESLVKQLSGGDKLAARFLFKEYFEYKPEFKIWWGFNSKPRINDTTQSIWDRVKLIPFTITIPPESRDKDLPQKLLEELPGILTWSIEGLKEYQRIGLAEPPEVRAATAEYRQEQDRLGEFFTERCILDPLAYTPSSDLYVAYQVWCNDSKEDPISTRAFGFEMNDRGINRDRDPRTNRSRYKGVRLVGQSLLEAR